MKKKEGKYEKKLQEWKEKINGKKIKIITEENEKRLKWK